MFHTAVEFRVSRSSESVSFNNTQGNRNGGRGGGKGAKKSQKTKKSTSKSPTNKKYLFTTLESTADVSVSTYETTLKKVYVYLMQNTKE